VDDAKQVVTAVPGCRSERLQACRVHHGWDMPCGSLSQQDVELLLRVGRALDLACLA
jgi:hypothetical protein